MDVRSERHCLHAIPTALGEDDEGSAPLNRSLAASQLPLG